MPVSFTARGLRAAALGAAFALAAPLAALAGPQYVDATGFALSGYDVTSYRDLTQAPVGQPQPAPELGSKQFTAEWNGATWAFASAENRDKFVANPEYYAPAYDGHCAYGVAKGGKVPGNPTLWRIVDDKLYVNITKNVVGFWEEDIPGNLSKSTGNWPSLEPKDASTNVIPAFTSPGPQG